MLGDRVKETKRKAGRDNGEEEDRCIGEKGKMVCESFTCYLRFLWRFLHEV